MGPLVQVNEKEIAQAVPESKKAGQWPASGGSSKRNYFFSIIFLHSAFILSSALAGSIFLHSSIFFHGAAVRAGDRAERNGGEGRDDQN
jgi:hypothetical protein